MEKQNIPALRFPEFQGEWTNNKLGELASFSKGKGISKSDITENGLTSCIRYGELYTHYGETISEIISKTNVPQKSLILSKANDVIIPASGETQIDIAKASCVLKEGIALGGDLNIIRTKSNGVFLSYNLNGKRKIDIARLAQGISVVHLYSSQLRLLNIITPTLPEQQKIASFLTEVDNKLQALKRKKELLEQYKKGIMQKLFSQELRFKDENGQPYPNWEKKKLGEVLTIGSGKDYKHLSEGEIPVYGTGGYMSSVSDFLYDGESIGIGRKGTINKPIFLKGKFWTVDTLFYTHSFKGVIPFFVYLIFQLINWLKYNEASGVPSLSKSTLETIVLDIPSLPEQTKIANFLTAIDQKIEQVSQQIAKAETWKKGLLQKMFV